MIWKIVSSEAFHVSLVEVESQWTLLDVLKAHDILDTIEEAAAQRAGQR